MRRLLSFAALAILLAPHCVADDWPMYAYNSQHQSHQPISNINAGNAGTLHINWTFLQSGAVFQASPSVFKEVVFIGATNGFFYAIHATGASQGTLKWRYPPAGLPGPIVDACGIIQQPLKLPNNQSNSSSGPGIASSAAIVEKGVPGFGAVVYFGAPDPTSNNGDGRLWALDADTGKCIWKSPVIAPATGNSKIGYSSPAISDGFAYIGVSARIPDSTLTVGKLFKIKLSDGNLDPNFQFNAANPPSGGGIWGSPAISPKGNPVIVTGNSCHHFVPPPVACPGAPIVPDYTNSLIELDYKTGQVLWQIQPVHIDWDNDPDWAVPPIVGEPSCGGTYALSVQKDGYLHAAGVKGVLSSDPACSYVDHKLECPKWSFPNVASLPFMEDGHGDTPFTRPGALHKDRLYITPGGYNLTEMPPTNISGNLPNGRIRFDRLYSFDICKPEKLIRWILTSPNGNFGGVSTTNGLIFAGTNSGRFFAIGDPEVVPPVNKVCEYPNIPLAMCAAANFGSVYTPVIVKNLQLSGGIRGIPAIAADQVIVATTSGRVYGLKP